MTLRKKCHYILVTLVMLLITSCIPVDDEGKPFGFSEGHSDSKINGLKAGDKFSLHIEINVVRPVRNIKFTLVIPKEVEVEEYIISTLVDRHTPLFKDEGPFKSAEQSITHWGGDLAPSKKQRERKESTWKNTTVFLRTKTDGAKWSEPIKGWIEFDYEREGEPRQAGIQRIESGHYREDFIWTHENWVSGKK